MHTTAHMLPTQRGSEYRTDRVFQWSSIKVMTIIIPEYRSNIPIPISKVKNFPKLISQNKALGASKKV